MADGMFGNFIKAWSGVDKACAPELFNPSAIHSVHIMRQPISGSLPQVTTQVTIAGRYDERKAPIKYLTDASLDGVVHAMRRAGQELVEIGEGFINANQVKSLGLKTGGLVVEFNDGTRPEFHKAPQAIADRLGR